MQCGPALRNSVDLRIYKRTVYGTVSVKMNIFIHQRMLIATNENKQRNNLN